MESSIRFPDLVRRVRQGDPQAAAELIEEFEPELRILARVRLYDPSLRRVVDSLDICQSVLGNFFVRASAGQFDLDTPEQLLKLLTTMIRNKITDRARRQHAGRRDLRRMSRVDAYEVDVPAVQDTPSQIVAARELAQLSHERFSEDERQLIERRKAGMSWDEIALDLGGSPEALRKKMTRAVNRVAQELGLEGVQ